MPEGFETQQKIRNRPGVKPKPIATIKGGNKVFFSSYMVDKGYLEPEMRFEVLVDKACKCIRLQELTEEDWNNMNSEDYVTTRKVGARTTDGNHKVYVSLGDIGRRHGIKTKLHRSPITVVYDGDGWATVEFNYEVE